MKTVTATVAALAISLTIMAAVSWVLFTKVVVRELPPHWTDEPEIKFDPLTVKVKAASPAVALGGEIEVRFGAGFCTGGGEGEPPPPPQLVSESVSAQMRLPIPNFRNRFAIICRLRIASR